MSDSSEAARILGRKRSPRKTETARENAVKARQRLTDPDVREKMRQAQQARRQRERKVAEQEAADRIQQAEKAAGRGE